MVNMSLFAFQQGAALPRVPERSGLYPAYWRMDLSVFLVVGDRRPTHLLKGEA